MEVDEEDTWVERLRFSVLLRVRHPSLKPDEISKGLGLLPDHSRCVGERRSTPAGTLLPGYNKLTLWSAGQDSVHQRAFFEKVMMIIDHLETFREFVAQITDTDGKVDIMIQLPGDINIGSDLTIDDLGRLYRLKVSIGVEVFPHMGEISAQDMVPYNQPT